MDEFIRRENLALFRRRLADPGLTPAQRQAILRLLAEEQAKSATAEWPGGQCPLSLGLSRSKVVTQIVGMATDDQALILINAANESHRGNAIDES
jgi:hypothetical protein